MKVCQTCFRSASTPFRVYNASGEAILGCVDDFHTGHLVTPSASATWHNRKEAKVLRTKARLAKELLLSGQRYPNTRKRNVSLGSEIFPYRHRRQRLG